MWGTLSRGLLAVSGVTTSAGVGVSLANPVLYLPGCRRRWHWAGRAGLWALPPPAPLAPLRGLAFVRPLDQQHVLVASCYLQATGQQRRWPTGNPPSFGRRRAGGRPFKCATAGKPGPVVSIFLIFSFALTPVCFLLYKPPKAKGLRAVLDGRTPPGATQTGPGFRFLRCRSATPLAASAEWAGHGPLACC
jgi:hypothetical protein